MSIKDVAIIGGGAAGSTAAFHLAKAGHKVIVLEKERECKIKPCAGGMASSVQKFFPFELKEVVDEVINKVEFTWCLSDNVLAELPGSSPFWIVKREMLDKFILENATEIGAEIIIPFKVEELQRVHNYWVITSSSGKQIEAKAVVIADGSNSKWPNIFGLGPQKSHYASTTSVRLQGRGNLGSGTTRFEFGLVKHGFAWAFPLDGGINIGVGTFIGKDHININKVLEKLLPSLGFEPNSGERRESLLRVWNGHANLDGNGILAIGDAASLCDPFLAEGLRPALKSGYEAAKALDHWLIGKNKNLQSYTITMRKEWGESMAWGRRIAQIFYRFPKIGYQLGVKRPTAPKRIAQILLGEMSYKDIATRVIKRLLSKG